LVSSSSSAFYDDTPFNSTNGTDGAATSSMDSNKIVGIILGFAIAIFVIAILVPIIVWIQKGTAVVNSAYAIGEKHIYPG
jgi:flagellar basal body-associated protein FliL